MSTTAGEGVYKKAGFKEIDRFVVDPRPFGGKTEVAWFCMRREPKPKGVHGVEEVSMGL